MKICHICGCDGTGKSTIISHLKSQFPATYIKEPHNPTLINLIKSSDDPHEKTILFLKDRQLLYNELLNTPQQMIISDRSFICNIVYQSLEMTDELPITSIYHIYNLNKTIPFPTHVIYLTTSPYLIANRINKRPNETSPTYHTIRQIQNRYKLVFKLLNITPLIIDTTHQSTQIQNLNTIIDYLTNT